MWFKNRELFLSAVLSFFPWTGSLLGGWCLVEGLLPPHRYEAFAAFLTLLWAFVCYPLYCRLAARNGLDPVRIVAFCAVPGILGVITASVWLFARLPLLGGLLSALPLLPAIILCAVLGCLLWFAPVALLVTHHTSLRKD